MNVKDFLENVKPQDKVALIFHDDLDGIVSGIFFYEFLEKRGCKNIQIFIRGYSKDLVSSIKSALLNVDKIIVLDLASNVLGEDFQKIVNKKEVLYIDHHVADFKLSGLIELRTPSAICVAQTSYQLLKNYLGDSKEWLSMIGTISDAGDRYEENKKIIEDFMKKQKISLEDFKQKYVYNLAYVLNYFEGDLQKAFFILKELGKLGEIKKLEKYYFPVKKEFDFFVGDFDKNSKIINGVHFYLFEPKFPIKSSVINEISYSNPEDIFLIGSPEGNLIKFSARCQSGKINLVDFLKKICVGCKDAMPGGHPRAAGMLIRKTDLDILKKNLSMFSF